MKIKHLLILFLIFSGAALISQAQEPIQIGTETEDIILTNDINISKAQVLKYPDNPEAHFNLAIALSRTSLVEEAIKELRKTKLLIRKVENSGLIEKKIEEYKEILQENQDQEYTNKVHYRLAFAYYLKAYLISKNIEKANKKKEKGKANSQGLNILKSNSLIINNHNTEIEESLGKSLEQFKTLLSINPNDIWTKIYYGFVLAEQYNNYPKAKELWESALRQEPNNPAPHFFLGELKIKEGNLKDGILEISQAILLRSLGN